MPVEKRAVCPACCRPLTGELSASACNAVFHRSCLASYSGRTCPKCDGLHPQCAEPSLDLFGVQFGSQEAEPPPRPKQIDLTEDGDACPVEASVEERKKNRERIKRTEKLAEEKERLQELQEKLKGKLEEVAAVKEAVSKHEQQVAVKEKELHKKKKEHAEVGKNIAEQDKLTESLLEELNFMRVRETAHEYWEKLREGKDDEALKYLLTMVTLGGHSWRILTEMTRLQAHVRKQLVNERKEAAAAANRRQAARVQLDDLETECRLSQRLDRGGIPPPKRLRSGQTL